MPPLDCWFLISHLLHDHCTNILNHHTLWLPTKTITRTLPARHEKYRYQVSFCHFCLQSIIPWGFGVLPRKSLLSVTLAPVAGQLVSAFQYTPLISTHGVGFASSTATAETEHASPVILDDALLSWVSFTDHGSFIGHLSKRKR